MFFPEIPNNCRMNCCLVAFFRLKSKVWFVLVVQRIAHFQSYTKSSCQRCFPDGSWWTERPDLRQKAYGLRTFSGHCHIGADCSLWHPHNHTENLTDALAHHFHITMVYELLSAEVRNELSYLPENHACYPTTSIHHWKTCLEH